MVLTIGLPLVGGLTIPQLAGVIAHELGHFSQGAGTKVSFFVRSMNAWFYRIVYERDDWDEKLVRGIEREDRFALILLFAMLCIWITRRLLWVLMLLGHGMSCFMLRRMEYDADRYETRLAGTEKFKETTGRLVQLGLASQIAFGLANCCWSRKRQLPNDLAELIITLDSSVAASELKKIESELMKSKTGLFDTHPANGDRIENARRENAPGIFHLDGPATRLFSDFAKLAQSTTLRYYREVLGNQVTPQALIPTSSALKGGDENRFNPLAR
jgi:Zn-dependent protease with chaperone function